MPSLWLRRQVEVARLGSLHAEAAELRELVPPSPPSPPSPLPMLPSPLLHCAAEEMPLLQCAAIEMTCRRSGAGLFVSLVPLCAATQAAAAQPGALQIPDTVIADTVIPDSLPLIAAPTLSAGVGNTGGPLRRQHYPPAVLAIRFRSICVPY